MAKYTITLGEYLKNNTLPEIFNNIENFSDLFILEFIDREIGFETEWLFSQKLLGRANLMCPLYAERLEKIQSIQDKLFSMLQVTRSENKNGNYNLGEQSQKTTNLPFDEETAEPNTISNTEAVINSELINTSYSDDLRPNELKVQYDEILNTKNFLLKRLIHEFDDLFMKIY